MFDFTDDIITASVARTDDYPQAPADIIGEWVIAVGTDSDDLFILPVAQARILAASLQEQIARAENGDGPTRY